jgi:hypothetical protein
MDKKIVGVPEGQVVADYPKVVGDVLGALKNLVIDLLKDIFDRAVPVPEHPGSIDQAGSKSVTMPVRRM